MIKKRIAALAVGTVLLVGTGVGIAEATIPDGSGIVHGCYNNYRGDLRVVDSSTSSCLADETSLNWNQSAPQAQVVQETFGAQFTSGGGIPWTLTNSGAFNEDCPTGTVPVSFQDQFDSHYGTNLTIKFTSTDYHLDSSGIPIGFKVTPQQWGVGDSVSETLTMHYYLVCQ